MIQNNRFTRSQSRSFAEFETTPLASDEYALQIKRTFATQSYITICMHLFPLVCTEPMDLSLDLTSNEATAVVPITWDNPILFLFILKFDVPPSLSFKSLSSSSSCSIRNGVSVSGAHALSLPSGEPYHVLPLHPMPRYDTLTFSPRVSACPAVTHNFSITTSPSGAIHHLF